MKENMNDIGDIFRKGLENAEVQRNHQGWVDLEKRLEKPKAGYFNKYYFFAGTLVIGFSLYFITNYWLSSKHKEQHTTTSESSQKDNESNNKLLMKSDFPSADIKRKERNKNEDVRKLIKNSIIENENCSMKDSVVKNELETIKPFEEKNQGSNLKQEKQEVENKIIYLTKQDTLIIVDTIDQSEVIKKRIKKKRK